jgi:hypothetical protein
MMVSWEEMGMRARRSLVGIDRGRKPELLMVTRTTIDEPIFLTYEGK